MRGLFLKIFAIFWVAQSLIFVISTALILRHRPPSPDAFLDTLSGNLPNEARAATAAFETGGCAALQRYAATEKRHMALEDLSGETLCATALSDERTNGGQAAGQSMWSLLVVSAAGKHYLYLAAPPRRPKPPAWYENLAHFAVPQLLVAIAVGGVTTFVLVLLFTRPLVRLRTAARELAQGKLNTRVKVATGHPSPFREDEFQALVHDFNHMAGRLESLVSAQQLLLRDVSHELRSPLARLSVALELAREDAEPEMLNHLHRIERETSRLNLLIGQLLTLSSMEAIERAENFESVSLPELILEVIPDAEYEAGQQQTSICFEASNECMVRGNRQLLYRAIENIVRNAVRYTDAGSQVEVRLKIEDDDSGGSAILEVSDHGPGIPESDLEAIFRPFYRVDYARSQDTGGFGVGLAIAERAVKLHNGKLRAFNRAGGGVTIEMRFPLHQPGSSSTVASRPVPRAH